MTVSITDRLGITRWGSGSDTFERSHMDDSHASLEEKAAGFTNTGGSTPVAGAEYSGFFHYSSTDATAGIMSYCNGTAWFTIGEAANTTPTALNGTAAAGTSDKLSRSDHKHEIASSAITGSMILDGAVTEGKIGTGAVTTTKLGAGAVTDAKVADVAATKLTGTISTAQIADSAVTTTKINALAVTTAKIAASAVTPTEIASDAVTTAKILDANVTDAKIASVATTKLTGSITTAQITDLAVTTAKIAALNITESLIATGAVTTDKLGIAAVTTAKIAAGAVTATEIATGAVGATQLATDAVTNSKMANNAVGTAEIIDASVTNAKIALDAVTLGTQSTGNYVATVATGNSGITITGSGSETAAVVVSHADTSSQASVDNSNGSVIQDVTVDGYGHVTALGTYNLDGRYYTESESRTLFYGGSSNDAGKRIYISTSAPSGGSNGDIWLEY